MNIAKRSSYAGLVGLCGLTLLSGINTMPAHAAFGLTNSGGYYTVDTGAGLIFKVNQTNGDVSSIKYNGTELNSTSKGSHLNSGLGSATVTATTYGTNYIKIAATTSTLTQYYMVRNGFNNIYMATYATPSAPYGELRWITRLDINALPNVPVPSDSRNGVGTVESGDVFLMADGTTRSKYYGNDQAINLNLRGVTGSGVGVFMQYGNRESSSGGPFYRDIQTQSSELYNYMFSGHAQTEAFRSGVLHGPYALMVTNGSTPMTAPDYNWIESGGLNLTGYVPTSGRGAVYGKAIGVPTGFASAVGFSNATAQYWCRPNASTGNYYSPPMKPGTYTRTLYKGELAVGSDTVTVTAGTSISSNVRSGETVPAQLWRIGEWDGAPTGFKNAANIPIMHPSDVRNSSWGPTTFTIGNAISNFPAVQWRNANSPTTIKFNLTASQIAAATLRIGITCAYEGGRPGIQLNSWNSPTMPISAQPSGRSFTIGTYRGNNTTYTFSIPATALVIGTNTLNIGVSSGSAGDGFLSPAFGYDCVELDSSTATTASSSSTAMS